MFSQVIASTLNSPLSLRPLCDLCGRPVSPSANSAPRAISALSLFPLFAFSGPPFVTRHSPLSSIIPALTAHPPLSPIIPALTQNRGEGVPSSQNPRPHNSFVFFCYVNYVVIYMNNYIVGAPTFWSAAARRRFCGLHGASIHFVWQKVLPSQKREQAPALQSRRASPRSGGLKKARPLPALQDPGTGCCFGNAGLTPLPLLRRFPL
jgi:hypothetical protein